MSVRVPPKARRRFAVNLTASLVGGYLLLIRPWHLRWGATDAEVSANMPGDDIVPRPQLKATRAIGIRARPAQVWPWLVQMGGYTRAGWYSYDRIDNAGRRSAERIIPELQRLRVGDVLPTAPDGRGFTVTQIAPERHLVLVIRDPGAITAFTCLLNPTGPGRTRLVMRLRVHVEPTMRGLAYLGAMDVGDFVMMRRMLYNIRRRAETPPGRVTPGAAVPRGQARSRARCD